MILIVDDEEAVCWALKRALTSAGQRVVTAASAEQAFLEAEKEAPEVIVLDVRLPKLDGLSALGRLRTLSKDAPVIVVTAFGNLTTAVRAVEGGAFDYLAKPFDLDQALETIARAQTQRKLQRQSPAQADGAHKITPDEMVGSSLAMQGVFKRIALVSPRDSCVLITGESGTGKEVVARAIHRHSSRRDRPFLPVHVAALSPGLVESELFGHVKGAFTGAVQARPGLFTLAEGGTLFFDEVGEIPLAVQVKLLRVLEYNEVTPVGGTQAQGMNVRILTATHQNLEKKVADGSFRHDLFFRLNVFQIHLPALRDRPEDIVPLAEHFLKRLEPRALPLNPATTEFLVRQPWLGNVRELRNALEHAVILAHQGPLMPKHFPDASRLTTGGSTQDALAHAVLDWLVERIKSAGTEAPQNLYEDLLHVVEPPLLKEVMKRLHENRLLAAQWLGLNRATVRKKLAAHGLTQLPPDKDDE